MSKKAKPSDNMLNKSPSANRHRSSTPREAILDVFVAFTIVLTIGAFIFGYLSRQWQYFAIAAAFGVSCLGGLFTIFQLWETKPESRGFAFIVITEIAFVLTSLVLSASVSLGIALVAIVFAIILGSTVLHGRYIELAMFVGLVAAVATALVGNLSLVDQVVNPSLSLGVFITAGFLTLILIILFFLGWITASIRVKLLLGGLVVTLVPLAILSAISNQYTQSAIKSQSNQSLKVAAEQTASIFDEFFSSNLEGVQTETNLPSIQRYLVLRPQDRPESVEETELATTFTSLQTKQKLYQPSYGLLDTSGINLFDTDASQMSQSEASTEYFKTVLNTGLPYSSSIYFPNGTRNAYLIFIAPIKDVTNQTIGYLRTRYDALLLQSKIQANVGLIGPRSYPILLDENGLRLADGYSPNLIYRTLVPMGLETFQALQLAERLPSYLPRDLLSTNEVELNSFVTGTSSGEFFTVTISGENGPHSESATSVTLQQHPWKVVFLQEQTNLIAARDAQNRLSTIIATIIAGIVGLSIIFASNLFTTPILQLTQAAEKIAAGDMGVEAKISSHDEIGILGNVFNSMTRQMKSFIDTLETRVKERTEQLGLQNEALRIRSTQLKTVSDVARNIVSSRDLETLLSSVTTLVSERFDFYHVGIFLIDEKNEYAVLRAANSTGGRKMLARQHKLQVGQMGIVGFVTQSGEPRIATDVGKDAVFFNNPDLPDTRSEMALPLKEEDKIIGALDVQSVESNAFTTEDIEMFSTLADQIAIAISNNQLYEDTRSALDEAQNLHRRYLNQEWTRKLREPGNTSYKYTPEGLVPIQEDLPEISTVLETGRPIYKSTSRKGERSSQRSILAVPILLRGESIGVIHLQEDRSEDFEWSENELAMVQAVSDQVAQTLENARLFESTVRRAELDRKVLEITGKIRSTNDPQQMLRVTLEELKRNLGITDGQVIINLPGGDQNEDRTNTLRPYPSASD